MADIQKQFETFHGRIKLDDLEENAELRWKDHRFPAEGRAAPVGIGLTLLVWSSLSPAKTVADLAANTFRYDDLKALLDVVKLTMGRFNTVFEDNVQLARIEARLPVEPYNDVFERMSSRQITELKERLTSLQDSLQFATDSADPIEACKQLKEEFGC